MPQRRLAHRLRQHPVAYRDDEAAVLGHRNEAHRRHLAQLGIAPAQQRLGADDAAVGQPHLRLVVQPEAVAHQGLSHGVVQPHRFAAVDLAAHLVQAEVGPTGGLHGTHGGVGVARQFVHAAAVRRRQRHADAAGERERRAVVAEGLCHHVQHAPRGGLGRRRVGSAEQQRELVAAQARQRVALAQAALQVFQCSAGLAPHRGGRVGDAGGQPRAVGQAGEGIGVGQGLDAFLRRHAFGEVTERVHAPARAAALEQRPRHAVQHLPGVQFDAVAGRHQRGLAQGLLGV